MNVFLVMAVHVLSFGVLVVSAVIAIYVAVLVCRKALTAQVILSSQARILQSQQERTEALVRTLGDAAGECYLAEVAAIYQPSPLHKGDSNG